MSYIFFKQWPLFFLFLYFHCSMVFGGLNCNPLCLRPCHRAAGIIMCKHGTVLIEGRLVKALSLPLPLFLSLLLFFSLSFSLSLFLSHSFSLSLSLFLVLALSHVLTLFLSSFFYLSLHCFSFFSSPSFLLFLSLRLRFYQFFFITLSDCCVIGHSNRCPFCHRFWFLSSLRFKLQVFWCGLPI